MELTETEMEIERDIPGHLIDIENGEYIGEFIEDLMNSSLAADLLSLLDDDFDLITITGQAGAIHGFREKWKEAKAYELARSSVLTGKD